jgi:hypothetical protein
VHIYNGDGGVEETHEGGRSRFTPLEVADVSVKVSCIRILGKLSIYEKAQFERFELIIFRSAY